MKLTENIYTIKNLYGLHVRPSGAFCKTAQQFESQVNVTYDGRTANGKSVMELLSLGVGYQEEIKITAVGKDSQDALNALASLIEYRFGIEEDYAQSMHYDCR